MTLAPLLAALCLSGCAESARDPAAMVRQVAEDAWQRLLSQSPYLQVKHGVRVTELPDATLQQAEADAAFARSLLDRIESIPGDRLSHEDELTLEILSWQARSTLDALPFYWHTFDFTPYIGGFYFNVVNRLFQDHPFTGPEDAASYEHLMDEYAGYLRQLEAKTRGQVERGIYFYRAAIPGVVGLLDAYKRSAPALFTLADERLQALTPQAAAELQRQVDERVDREILPAFEDLIALLSSDEYAEAAPAEVGVRQYEGGEELYRYLVRLHTTLDATPEELHALGEERVAELSARMAEIRAELGFAGTQDEFHEKLRHDRRFLAETPQEVEERFRQYVARIEPRVGDYFRRMPQAPYGVQRLNPAAEAGMTFGYYQVPTPDEPRGLYRYNGSNLSERSLIFAGPLIYHELVPGHHFHLALQSENEALPMYRREFMTGAFNEGWGNYGSQLASEMGLLDDPYDQYAWAIFDMFISVRLVVDTGMNYFGWTLEEGRDYMRRHTFQSETEILSETLRYSTDMPGQALGYKAGLERLLELREIARGLAGDSFDIRDFHDAILGSGAMPYPLLERHVRWYFDNREGEGRSE